MFIDASAIVAILNRDAGSDEMVKRLAEARKPIFSPITRFDAITRLANSRSGPNPSATPEQLETAARVVDMFLAETEAKSVMISDSIANMAIKAALTYGPGLNTSACFAYACAKGYHVPLLYAGGEFSKTDLG